MQDNRQILLAPIAAGSIPSEIVLSNYPEPFASRMKGRTKRRIGQHFGITNFGVNLTVLAPGAVSALQHSHSLQDELIYVVEGELVLISGAGQYRLREGDCIGFPAGGPSHHLENRSGLEATYLEVGDRSSGDHITYPFDDLAANNEGGSWRFSRKNGEPW